MKGFDLLPADTHLKHIGFCGFHTGQGGIGHVMINLINGFADAGLTVDLLIANRGSPHLADISPKVEVVEIGSNFFGKCVPNATKYLKSARPDWVISNREKAHRYMALARQLAGTETRLAFRVGNSLAETLKKRNWLKRTLRQSLIRWAYSKADLVIVNSKGLCEDVQHYAGIELQRIQILNNPTFGKHVLQQAQEDVDHPWFVDKSVPVVLGVGRLTRQKDFPTLIKAFAKVAEDRPVRLIILGEGNDRAALQALVDELGIRERVCLLGFVSNPFSFMAKCDLFVLSSAWEGSPNVLIQALSVGCPVVATDCPEGPREILQGGRVAPLVKVGDDEGLAEAICSCLDHPQNRHALLQAALPFAVKTAVAAYLEALHESDCHRLECS